MKETTKAYQAYLAYRNMGPGRSLQKLGQTGGKLGASMTSLETWSSHHDWQERVKEYDAEQAEQEQCILRAERKEARARQAEHTFQTKGAAHSRPHLMSL